MASPAFSTNLVRYLILHEIVRLLLLMIGIQLYVAFDRIQSPRPPLRRAAELVSNGDSILLDASSTSYYLALELSGRKKLRVMTNGFEVARELAQNSTNTVILIGGVVNNDSSSVTGLLSEQVIAEMHIEKAFFSCSGFSIQRGMTEVHLEEAQLKRKAMGSSKQVIALIDSSKLGKEDLAPFAQTDQITHLVTDSELSAEWVEKLREAGIDFTICEMEATPTLSGAR